MNCEQAQDRLHDYLDDDLDAPERQALESHLKECSACGEALGEFRCLLACAEALPSEILPDKNLWPGIVSRLDGASMPQHRAGRGRWLMVGVLPLAAALVLGVVFLFELNTTPTGPRQPDAAHSKGDSAYEQAKTDYAEARTALWEAIEARQDVLAPGTRQVLAENLAVIDNALEQIQHALESSPSDPRLFRLLTATRQQGLEFMKTVVRLTAEM